MVNLIKKMFCKFGWHSFGYNYTGFDGANLHAECKWCKYKGMVDSQGNLF
jgi:hypothetical protein